MKSYIKNKEINVSRFKRKVSETIERKFLVTNRNFWKIIRPLLTNKGHLENAEIMLIRDKKIISNENGLLKAFNKHYINIFEKSGGQKPTNTAKSYPIDTDK